MNPKNPTWLKTIFGELTTVLKTLNSVVGSFKYFSNDVAEMFVYFWLEGINADSYTGKITCQLFFWKKKSM